MPLMLDVSDEVRAEIGDAEADRLIAGENAPDTYDCTSCRNPGDTSHERTSTVLFIGGKTAVLAFAHANCSPSQVVAVSEEQLLGAVQSTPQTDAVSAPAPTVPPAPAAPAAHPAPSAAATQPRSGPGSGPAETPLAPSEPAELGPAVLGITCGLVLCQGTGRPAIVVEPTGPIVRPGSTDGGDEFLSLLIEHGFIRVSDVEQPPAALPGWSVLVTAGRLHAVLQPGSDGKPSAWWQAHQPLPVTEAWRDAANRLNQIFVYAVPVGVIGHQPREDLLRKALEKAAAQGVLLAATLQLTGT